MADTSLGGHVEGFGATRRTDRWWVGPSVTFVVFSAWLIYFFTVAALGSHWAAGPYISPFYLGYAHPENHELMGPGNALFGLWPDAWPAWLSPALFVGGLPGMFRLSCYYYRKAYYRAFFGTPPACAVGPRPENYQGETRLLIIQNLHRYTLYIAILLLPFLALDVFNGMRWEGRWGIGVGTILLLVNLILLSGYTLGCHAWRHLVGGKLNCFSCDGASEARHGAWSATTWLNQRHQEFAWASLLWIAGTDLYIRLVSMGVIPDLNTWHGITWVNQFYS
jgi:hypothetical protein